MDVNGTDSENAYCTDVANRIRKGSHRAKDDKHWISFIAE
jgi:hypothetical protein